MPATMRMGSGQQQARADAARVDESRRARGVIPSPAPAEPTRSRARRCPTCRQAFSGEARFCPFDGDPLASAPDWDPAADPLRGKIIDGRYEVLSVLGEGGMGTVYEVRHVTLERRFAVKVLRRDIADDEHVARFVQEAKAAAAIGHPNIVAVSDFGELHLGAAFERAAQLSATGPGMPYFVMEFLTGASLASVLRAEKTLAPERAAGILRQCAAGLAAAHAAGVVHRDLKPDNVFLTGSGEHEFVKLLDFGVAKMAGSGRLTRAGMVFGTPHYMSPEQAGGNPVDHRADVYALGVILYECLCGRVPFEADTYMGVLTKHMFAQPEPIERVAPDASRLGDLGLIAMRCLAKDPGERFQTMDELGAALAAALGAGGVATPNGRALVGGRGSNVRPAPDLRLRSDDSLEARLRALESAGSGTGAGAAIHVHGAPPGSQRGDAPAVAGLRPVVSPLGVSAGIALLALACVLGWLAFRPESSTVLAASASSAPASLPATAADAAAPGASVPTEPSAAGSSAGAPEASPSAVAPTGGAALPVADPKSSTDGVAAPATTAVTPPSPASAPAAVRKNAKKSRAPVPAPTSKRPPARRGGDVIDPWAN